MATPNIFASKSTGCVSHNVRRLNITCHDDACYHHDRGAESKIWDSCSSGSKHAFVMDMSRPLSTLDPGILMGWEGGGGVMAPGGGASELAGMPDDLEVGYRESWLSRGMESRL